MIRLRQYTRRELVSLRKHLMRCGWNEGVVGLFYGSSIDDRDVCAAMLRDDDLRMLVTAVRGWAEATGAPTEAADDLDALTHHGRQR